MMCQTPQQHNTKVLCFLLGSSFHHLPRHASPNAFSPNGDGINDLFAPILTDIDYETYEINIFNRWGDIVFKTNNYDESWDGTFKGENLPQAVYTYKITYKTRRGIDKQERGDIVLVK